MKRQAEGPLLMPECDDAEKEEDYFFMRGIYLTFPPTLELLIEKLRNCELGSVKICSDTNLMKMQ